MIKLFTDGHDYMKSDWIGIITSAKILVEVSPLTKNYVFLMSI